MRAQALQLKNKPYIRRFARVLFDLAKETNQTKKILGELSLVNGAIEKVPHLLQAIQDKRISLKSRKEAAINISKSLALSDLLTHTVLYLLDKNHFDLFPMLAPEYQKITETVEGLARAQATVADKILTKEVKTQIEQILTNILKTKSVCDVSIDPKLIGGILLKIGDIKLDTSIIGKLKMMQEELL